MAHRIPVTRPDVVLALIVGGGASAELLTQSFPGPLGPQVVEVALGVAAFAIRRRAPLAAVVIASVALLQVSALSEPPELLTLGLAGIVIAFTAATLSDPRKLAAAIGLLSVAVLIRDLDDPEIGGWFNILLDQIFNVLAFAAGFIVRSRQHAVEHVASTASELTRDAVADERARIARELHDVIAHGLTVMVVQADAARGDTDDAEARRALRSIEDTGRASLREMRRLLGLLRDADAGAPTLEPQPGLADIGRLVASLRRAGLPVDVTIEGTEVPLSPGLDLAAYRIVQEALTNCLRHAGPTRTRVRVAYGRHDLTLEIADDGRGGTTEAPGKGLVGMRERTRLYGGTLDAGPTTAGFRVLATLPLERP